MKISDLKQPYRRMAEYYRIVERSELTGRIEIYIPDEFPTPDFNNWFWTEIKKGKHPEITEEIKEHFPSDFDFSEDDVKEIEIPFNFNIFNSMFKNEVKNTFYLDAKKHYTQLAKEGRFDQLPETCEFSEPVEMDVWDLEGKLKITKNVIGKFKGKFISGRTSYSLLIWNYAQLPTKKIDFTQFKTGDIVEVDAFGLYYGYLESNKEDYIQLSFSSFSTSTRRILKKDIKSITILK
jgi:hypothetical protein